VVTLKYEAEVSTLRADNERLLSQLKATGFGNITAKDRTVIRALKHQLGLQKISTMLQITQLKQKSKGFTRLNINGKPNVMSA
jgi:hypothetical protein